MDSDKIITNKIKYIIKSDYNFDISVLKYILNFIHNHERYILISLNSRYVEGLKISDKYEFPKISITIEKKYIYFDPIDNFKFNYDSEDDDILINVEDFTFNRKYILILKNKFKLENNIWTL